MGRAYEFRKARKMKRWSAMAKAFTRVGREIAIAVREGGANPDTNTRLRIAMQNAKSVNMPKTTVENAIKKAAGKDAENYEEMVYEGYGPHAVGIVVECATDNPTRTVANVRSYFNKTGGALGKTGSLDFIFDRKAVFKINSENVNLEDLEFELIDYGAEEVFEEDGEVYIYAPFSEFGSVQKAIEAKGLELISAESQRIPNSTVQLTEEQAAQIEILLEKLEEDDDVINVFHNMA